MRGTRRSAGTSWEVHPAGGVLAPSCLQASRGGHVTDLHHLDQESIEIKPMPRFRRQSENADPSGWILWVIGPLRLDVPIEPDE